MPSTSIRFATFTLDLDRLCLHGPSGQISLRPKSFDVLRYLAQHTRRVLSKDEVMQAVWPNTTVTDESLVVCIGEIRRALGDAEQQIIKTVPRRGYLFDVQVSTSDIAPTATDLTTTDVLPKLDTIAGKGLHFTGAVCNVTESGEPPHAAGAPPDVLQETSRPALPTPDRPAIAVLPFINMSADPEQDYFSDGISEDIITALSKLRWFFVIARNSSFTYKGKSVHMKQVGEELGVGYVVEGSVRRSGNRVRITAQLNDVSTGSHLWAERYDRALADVFAVQDEITDAIVAAIEPQIYAAEDFQAQRKPPESLDAWGLLVRALSHYWRMTRQDNVVAQTLLEKAIAISPNYGQALAVLSVTHVSGALWGWEDRATAVPIAERAARAAIRADSEDAWAHLAVAGVYPYLGRLEDALAEFESALSLNPNFSLAHAHYGLVLSWVGRWQDGSNAARRALRLSPRDPFSAIFNGVAAYAEFVGRNYTEAIRLAREAVRARSDIVGATASLPPPPAWRAKSRSPGLRCRNCAVPNPISRSPGSRSVCRSGKISGRIFWKACAARASISSTVEERVVAGRSISVRMNPDPGESIGGASGAGLFVRFHASTYRHFTQPAPTRAIPDLSVIVIPPWVYDEPDTLR